MLDMRRRDLIALVGSAAAAWPRLGLAQDARKTVSRIGVLLFGTPDTDPNLGAFRRGLRDVGYVESENIVIEYRYAEGRSERLRGLAAELVSIKPDLIFALGGDVAPLVRAATSTIPIVMAVSVDPVQSGLVASLARPGGNITGVTFVSSDLAAKRLQLLREMAPNVTRIAVIWNPDHIDPEYRETQAAAKTLGIQIQSLEVRTADEFPTAFQTAVDARSEALIPVSSRLMLANRLRIMQFAAQRQLLVASSWALWAREGALFSYGPDLDAITRRAATYVGKILHGARPDELPVEQPTTFQLVINSKTAKANGLDVPKSLLTTADEVIE
jgi:putative tryptophan/tyrosine transport system substrate-binding protein